MKKTAKDLFVPLCTDPYEDFKNRGKIFEIRNCRGQFTPKHVYSGKGARIRKGYSGEQLTGIVGEVFIDSTLSGLFRQLPHYNLAEPRAHSLDEAIRENEKYSGTSPNGYIAFEVRINRE